MKQELKTIRHHGIYVRNIDLALRLYRDVLGMKIVKREIVPASYISTWLDIDEPLEYVKLSLPNESSLFELCHFTGGYWSFPGYCFTHVAFTVRNIKTLQRKLRTLGLDVFHSALDPERKNLVLFFRDYDGNLIELVETKQKMKRK